MWRVLLVLGMTAAILSACSGEQLSAREEFTKRTDQFEDAEYTVTYQVDGVSQVDSVSGGVASSMTVTVYSDGLNRRADYEDDEGIRVSISSEAAHYRCWSAPGEANYCFENPGGGWSSPSFGLDHFALMIQAPEDWVLSRADSRKVAGVDSECFLSAHEDVQEGKPFAEICLGEDGLVVYANASSEGSVIRNTTRAVAIERSVPEGIFEQPYPLHPCEVGRWEPGCTDAAPEE